MGILVVLVSIMGIAAGVYLLSQTGLSGLSGGGGAPVGSSTELGFVYEDTSVRRAGTVEFETHPIERLAMMGKGLPGYAEVAAGKVDPDEAAILRAKAEVLSDTISTIDATALIQSIHGFSPLQGAYFMSLEVELGTVIEELTQLINQLPQFPQVLNLIEARVETLLRFCHGLDELMAEWRVAMAFQSELQANPSIIVNKLQIISDQELLETELKDFFNLYFAIRAFEMFDELNRERISDLHRQTEFCSMLMNRARTQFTEIDHRELQRIARTILNLLRSTHDYYYKFFAGMTLALEKFRSSRIKVFSENVRQIESLLILLQKDLVPVAERFSVRGGSGEVDFNKVFQKVLSVHSTTSRNSAVPAGAAEGLLNYLNYRIHDIEGFMASEIRQFLHGPMEQLWRELRKQMKSEPAGQSL